MKSGFVQAVLVEIILACAIALAACAWTFRHEIDCVVERQLDPRPSYYRPYEKETLKREAECVAPEMTME